MSLIGERIARIEVHVERSAQVLDKLENGELPMCKEHSNAIFDLKKKDDSPFLSWGKWKAQGPLAIVALILLAWMYFTHSTAKEAEARTDSVAEKADTVAIKVKQSAKETHELLQGILDELKRKELCLDSKQAK